MAHTRSQDDLWGIRNMAESAARRLPPPGQRVDLPGRGSIFVRHVDGPAGAMPVVLIHGWIASGGLNWFRAFDPLRRSFRVIAPDMRGHGRGIRSLRPFQLADCADDIAALLESMQIGPAVVVGYSMGGPVSQLLWKRHRDRVAGLVLVATSSRPVRTDFGARVFGDLMCGAGLAGRIPEAASWLPRQLARVAVSRRPPRRASSLSRWARAEFGRHNVRHLIEAGAELGRYDARSWISEIDVPTAVVVTVRDRAMPSRHQLAMAHEIPGASVHRLDAGHLSCMSATFGHSLADACRDVADRARSANPGSARFE